MEFNNKLIIDKKQALEFSEKKDKTTIIMSTSQSDIRVLMWSLFSLLLRTNEIIENICININGDWRECELQNIKQKFLEKLYFEYQVPISLFRIWGRQGHSHSIDGCTPWVHTEYYTLMHDDVIVLKNWPEELVTSGYLNDDKRSIMLSPPILMNRLQVSTFNGKNKIGIPHLNTCFTHVKKSIVDGLGLSWHGHHCPLEFTLEGKWAEEFLDFCKDINKNVALGQKFYFYNADVGSRIWCELIKNNYNIYTFTKEVCAHIQAASWSSNEPLEFRLHRNREQILSIENEILDSRFSEIYKEFCSFSSIEI